MSRGGTRPGAGRPRVAQRKRSRRTTVALSAAAARALDATRGARSRAEEVERLTEELDRARSLLAALYALIPPGTAAHATAALILQDGES